MYWEEGTDQERFRVPDDVVDVVFGIACRCLPVDHAHALRVALTGALPWLSEEPQAGVHPIHVADSGNGWMRPAAADALLYPSRRTRLVLRLPQHRIQDASRLEGRTLVLGDHRLTVQTGTSRPLSAITTIFSRYVVADPAHDEDAFLRSTAEALTARGIRPKKMLCGIAHRLRTPDGEVRTRSLMLADLSPEESVALQQTGLGPERLLGCGLFIPHKGIKEIGKPQD
ncbi:MAG TPA: type I-MYXAN CRISPR-associated protein Cas6/Cmx6 [Acidiferrobacterales bacterium]|jgi:CRISPR-associated protein Cas6